MTQDFQGCGTFRAKTREVPGKLGQSVPLSRGKSLWNFRCTPLSLQGPRPPKPTHPHPHTMQPCNRGQEFFQEETHRAAGAKTGRGQRPPLSTALGT